MIKLNLQLLGGRGASSGTSGGGSGSNGNGGDNSGGSSGGGGSFKDESDFEKSLTGSDDPRLAEYSNAYDDAASYTSGLKNNIGQAINEDGFTPTIDSALKSEEKIAKDYIKNLPELKTPSQLGESKAMEDRLQVIKDLQSRRGEKGNGIGDVDILA